jgi:histidine triad (HIT) family protein
VAEGESPTSRAGRGKAAPEGKAALDCHFCEIVAGERDAHVVHEGERTLAFLDNRPLFPGHTLLVPRDHHEALWDLPPDLVEPLFADARVLAAAIRDAMGAQGAFVAANNVVSQSVPHLHVHVVPRSRKDGLRGFFWPRTKYEGDDHMSETAEAVRAAVAQARANGAG